MRRIGLLSVVILAVAFGAVGASQGASAFGHGVITDPGCYVPADTSVTCENDFYVYSGESITAQVTSIAGASTCLFQVRGYFSNTRYGPLTELGTSSGQVLLYTWNNADTGQFKLNAYCSETNQTTVALRVTF